jgi:hypothetical protein
VHPGRPGESVLRERELQLLLPAATEVQVGVGVRADFLAVPQFLADQPWIAGHVCAYREERGRNVVAAEDVQNPRGPDRIWPVVEGQRDGSRRELIAARVWAGRVDDRAAGQHRSRRGRAAGCGLSHGCAGLAEHAVGVALDQQTEREHQHDQADQDPVGTRRPAAPVPRVPVR